MNRRHLLIGLGALACGTAQAPAQAQMGRARDAALFGALPPQITAVRVRRMPPAAFHHALLAQGALPAFALRQRLDFALPPSPAAAKPDPSS